MRTKIFIIFLVFASYWRGAFAQPIDQVLDTLCVQGNPSYLATDTIPGNTYQWNIPGGQVLQGGSSPNVLVQWNTVGLHDLYVISTDSNGCSSDTLKASVYVTEPEFSTIKGPYTVCKGERITLEGISGSSAKWSTNETTPMIDLVVDQDTMIYLVTFNGPCPNDTAYHYIEVIDNPIADFTMDKDSVTPRETVTFTTVTPYFQPTHEVKWFIDGVEIFDQNQIFHAFYDPGEKEVELVVSTEGCGDTIVKSLFVWEDFQLHVPNAFTPNGDGLNDVFLFKGVGLQSFSAVITNRWGDEVYSWSDDPENGWDGTHNGIPVPAEVYTYRIVAYDYHGRAHKFFGHLTVVR